MSYLANIPAPKNNAYIVAELIQYEKLTFVYRFRYTREAIIKDTKYFEGSVTIGGCRQMIQDAIKNFSSVIMPISLDLNVSINIPRLSFEKTYSLKRQGVYYFCEKVEYNKPVIRQCTQNLSEGDTYYLAYNQELEADIVKSYGGYDGFEILPSNEVSVPNDYKVAKFTFLKRAPINEYACAKAQGDKRVSLQNFINDLGEVAKRLGFKLLTTDVANTTFLFDEDFVYVPAKGINLLDKSMEGNIHGCRFPLQWLKRGAGNHKSYSCFDGAEYLSIHEIPTRVISNFMPYLKYIIAYES